MSKPFFVRGDKGDLDAVVCVGKGRGGVTPLRPLPFWRPDGLGCRPVRQATPPHRSRRHDALEAAVVLRIGGCLLATAFVWGLVLGWWQAIDHQPTAADLAIHLGVLPLVLICGYFLLRGFIDYLLAPLPVASSGGAAGDGKQPLATPHRQAAAERGPSLCLLDACMITPGGRSSAALLAAIESGQGLRPSARLLDEAGFPVFVAAVEGLDLSAVAERLQVGLPAQEAWLASDEALRSLALLDGVLREALQRLAGLVARPGLQLRCICLLPAHWDTAHFPWLHSWLQRSYFAGFAPGRCELSLVLAADDAAALRHVDDLCVALNREPEAERVVLLASAVSAIDARVVAERAARGRLSPAHHPEPAAPGECAVALLLASPVQALRLAGGTVAPVQLGRLATGRPGPVAVAGGRFLGPLIREVLAAWQLDGAQLTALVSDGDRRASQAVEALEALAAVGAHLDPLADCLAIGTVVGSASPAGGLVALACAASRALANQGPVLCLGNQDDSPRAALLVRPLAVPPPGQPPRT